MCLAVPGKIIEVKRSDDDPVTGSLAMVDFQGSRVEVSLAFTPEAKQGDWVLVHAGFALNTLDEDEAKRDEETGGKKEPDQNRELVGPAPDVAVADFDDGREELAHQLTTLRRFGTVVCGSRFGAT